MDFVLDGATARVPDDDLLQELHNTTKVGVVGNVLPHHSWAAIS